MRSYQANPAHNEPPSPFLQQLQHLDPMGLWSFQLRQCDQILGDQVSESPTYETVVDRSFQGHNRLRKVECRASMKSVRMRGRSDLGLANADRRDHELNVAEKDCKQQEPMTLQYLDGRFQLFGPHLQQGLGHELQHDHLNLTNQSLNSFRYFHFCALNR